MTTVMTWFVVGLVVQMVVLEGRGLAIPVDAEKSAKAGRVGTTTTADRKNKQLLLENLAYTKPPGPDSGLTSDLRLNESTERQSSKQDLISLPSSSSSSSPSSSSASGLPPTVLTKQAPSTFKSKARHTAFHKFGGKGEGEGDADGAGRGRGGVGYEDRIEAARGAFPLQNPDLEDIGLRYLLLLGRGGNNGRSEEGQRQSLLSMRSRFASNVPPLAMAEYLLLTGDFAGFEDALSDIVAIGMMAPVEAEIYRQNVRFEYQSLLQQEAEVAAANLYGAYSDVMPPVPEEVLQKGELPPLLPSISLEYPDYGYYGNLVNDYDEDLAPPPPPKHDVNANGPPHRPPGDDFGEMLQRMIDSIAGSDLTADDQLAMKSSDVMNKSVAPSTPSSLTEQLKDSPANKEKENGGKPGKGGTKSGKAKGGGGPKKNGGKEKTTGKGRKKESGGKSSLSLSSSSASSEPSKDSALDAENELKVVAMTKNRTKEENGTKTRRPLTNRPRQ